MKILVTGGAGYIGSHTVVALQQEGHEVVVVDDLSNSYRTVMDQIASITHKKPHFEEFDLSDRAKTEAFFYRHHNLDGVIHFAAHKAVGESVEKPLKYYRNNLVSLMNLLEGMEKTHVPFLVFSSSCTVYGEPEELPVSESAPIKPATSPYGNTKQVSEEIIRDTAKNSPIKAILLRYFNPVGAHESAKIGELPMGTPNNLVPYITQTAAGIREQLSVFGNDYHTPDGTAIRDYIHVEDLAKAHIKAIERMANNRNKEQVETFNVGTGNGYSVLEVIRAFEEATGQPLNYRFAPRRAGDVEKVWAETSLAQRELQWRAEKSLDEMMASAWEWQLALKNNPL
ncbi:MAG: UDP-glucose 4-epimerase GalE [Bacteroidetes bacterium]|nr:MAG: UDP-glucose 4-epimerase GalE [Bacteroidota bacterium]PIE87698.1 MAG: UDP-glucose 4-epimerase GalE [Bacteroidota bacterium]